MYVFKTPSSSDHFKSDDMWYSLYDTTILQIAKRATWDLKPLAW